MADYMTGRRPRTGALLVAALACALAAVVSPSPANAVPQETGKSPADHGNSGLTQALLAPSSVAADPDSLAGVWVRAKFPGTNTFESRALQGASTAPASAGQPGSVVSVPGGGGYWVVSEYGTIENVGSAPRLCDGDLSQCDAYAGRRPIVGATTTPDGKGLWALDADGKVFSAGDAVPLGDAKVPAGAQPSSIASVRNGHGYYVLTNDGTVAAFGDAKPYGRQGDEKDEGAQGIAVAPDDKGYWIVDSNGRVTAFGTAEDYGSPGQNAANKVTGITALPHGGYATVRENGHTDYFTGVFSVIGKESGKLLDVEGNSELDHAPVDIWPYNGGQNQRWELHPEGDDAWTIRSVRTGKCLSVANTGDGAAVRQEPCGNPAYSSQSWVPVPAGDGFVIKNAAWDKVLDVTGHGTTNGTKVIQWPRNDGDNQIWHFEHPYTIKPGNYQLEPKTAPGSTVGVPHNSTDNGELLQLAKKEDIRSQVWTWRNSSHDEGKLVNGYSGLCARIFPQVGAAAHQFNCNGDQNQDWHPQVHPDGYISLVSANGLALAAVNSNGQWSLKAVETASDGQADDAQLFKISQWQTPPPTVPLDTAYEVQKHDIYPKDMGPGGQGYTCPQEYHPQKDKNEVVYEDQSSKGIEAQGVGMEHGALFPQFHVKDEEAYSRHGVASVRIQCQRDY